MSSTISHHQALIYVMVTMAAVDREISDSELLGGSARSSRTCRYSPISMKNGWCTWRVNAATS